MSARLHRAAALTAWLLTLPLPAAAQDAPPPASADPRACELTLDAAEIVGGGTDQARVLDLSAARSRHSFLFRRTSDLYDVDACAGAARIAALARNASVRPLARTGYVLLPARTLLTYNSAYPRDWNDGALHGGAGIGLRVAAGARLRWRALEAALAPELILQQNASFVFDPYPGTEELSRFAHRWHGRYIDLPQRFGYDSEYRVDAGQSFLRVNAAGVRAGVSNENMIWGPALRNPLLLSGTAPGFAHLFVETARPRDIGIGHAEALLFYGRLAESKFFDFDPDNDRRALSGWLLTLRPRGLGGLFLGAGHLHMQTWRDDTPASDILLAPFRGLDRDSIGFPRDLRLFSLFMRWAAPAGFEVYGEWARQDTWEQWIRMLNPVDASQAYTLGLQKIVRRGDNAVRVRAEVAHTADALSHTDVGRGRHTYYVSPHVRQGHTHRGQLLGAPIGPGSESQFIGVDVWWSQGRTGMSVERARYDDDTYFAVWSQVHQQNGHDAEISLRASHMAALHGVLLEAELGYSFRYSRSFLGLHHVNAPDFPYREDHNIGLRLTGRWTPPLP